MGSALVEQHDYIASFDKRLLGRAVANGFDPKPSVVVQAFTKVRNSLFGIAHLRGPDD